MNTPYSINDPINQAILMVAEDCVAGFHRRPFQVIARQAGMQESMVIERLGAMLQAGVVRRIRQTLVTTKLAQGALVAWQVPDERLNDAFAWLQAHDPFTGHIVIRHTDLHNPGADYRLWTTLKIPVGANSLQQHCELLKKHIHATQFTLLPAHGVFTLGVGHLRRRQLKPGDKSAIPAPMQTTELARLTPTEWQVLLSLKDELARDELVSEPWRDRAAAIDIPYEQYCAIAQQLDARGLIGRFATFLEHLHSPQHAAPVTKYNGLFHWTVPDGMEQQAGQQCARHLCMTHCYWRTGGAPFGGAQIMGVVHGLTKETVLEHKAAIDAHLAAMNIPVLHTAVFWSERSLVKPSEISFTAYQSWWERVRKLQLQA